MKQESLIGCPVEWFAWAYGLTKSKEQFALALYLYRRACVTRSATVSVPNGELADLGFGGPVSKHRQLLNLEAAGIIRPEQRNGRTARVTLSRWP